MKKSILTVVVMLLCSTAYAGGSPFAPRPLSITAVERGETADGVVYTEYAVKCTNRDYAPMIGFSAEREWCAANNECSRDKIRAAKTACKAGAGSLDETGIRMISKRRSMVTNPS